MTDSVHLSSQQGPGTADGGASSDETAISAYRALAQWWGSNARDFPWRFGKTTPWGILVSEVMSQQTPMSRVLPYWEKWMGTWPGPQAVSEASTAEIISAWGHLGYPRRALRLQECARTLVRDCDGRLPASYDGLTALPGIGDYTASAVLSFAFGIRIPVIDTNIRRVLVRVFDGAESTGGAAGTHDRELAARVLPAGSHQSVVWNQSVMELGAVVCTAKKPRCAVCPLNSLCRFYAAGLPGLGQKPTRPRQKFRGTNRYVRGLILKTLREAEAETGPGTAAVAQRRSRFISYSELKSLWNDTVQLDGCIASLDEDGLIVINKDHSVSLPR